MLASAIHHFNMGSTLLMSFDARLELAKRNLMVAENMIAQSGYILATDYLQHGLDLLHRQQGNNNNNTMWDPSSPSYSIALQLSVSMARMSFICHDYVRCKHMIDEVIQNTHSFDDKFDVYCIHVRSLGAQGRIDEACDVGLKVLSVLGAAANGGGRGGARAILRVASKAAANPKSIRSSWASLDANVRNRVVLHDTNRLRTIQLLRILAVICQVHHVEDDDMLYHVQSHAVKVSAKHGISPLSAFGAASIGMILAKAGHYEDGHRFGTTALEISKTFHSVQWDCMAVATTHALVHHWSASNHNHNMSLTLFKAYQAALDQDDLQSAFYCASAYCDISFLHSGLPLTTLLEETRRMCNVVKHYSHEQDPILLNMTPLLQMMLNLTGHGSCSHHDADPTQLGGEAMDRHMFLTACRHLHADEAILRVEFFTMQLAYMFGDIANGYELSLKLRDVTGMQAWNVMNLFYCALLEMEMFRQTGQSRHQKEARKLVKRFSKWIANNTTAAAAGNNHNNTSNNGSNNASHYDHLTLLLEAELGAIKKGSKGVAKAFDKAIAASAHVLCNQALANERAAAYFLESGDTPSACEYMTQARGLYTKWGAYAKVDQVKEKYKFLFYDMMTTASSKQRKNRRKTDNRLSFGKAYATATTLNKTRPGM